MTGGEISGRNEDVRVHSDALRPNSIFYTIRALEQSSMYHVVAYNSTRGTRDHGLDSVVLARAWKLRMKRRDAGRVTTSHQTRGSFYKRSHYDLVFSS